MKLKYFEMIAAGEIDAPVLEVEPEIDLFCNNTELINFSNCHFRLRGNFDKHYWASIPYAFEQECRLGVTIIKYSSVNYSSSNPLKLWCINMAEATLARSLSVLGEGRILSVANTNNPNNTPSFYAHGVPDNVDFLLLSDKETIKKLSDKNSYYNEGFDLIIEDTSFQMKSKDRFSQITDVRRLLKPDGLIIMTEKFLNKNFLYWEKIKDEKWKSRFFHNYSIERKNNIVLQNMHKNLVEINDFLLLINKMFSYSYVIWNSGNFYSIIAGDNKKNISSFTDFLGMACIPKKFSEHIGIIQTFQESK